MEVTDPQRTTSSVPRKRVDHILDSEGDHFRTMIEIPIGRFADGVFPRIQGFRPLALQLLLTERSLDSKDAKMGSRHLLALNGVGRGLSGPVAREPVSQLIAWIDWGEFEA